MFTTPKDLPGAQKAIKDVITLRNLYKELFVNIKYNQKNTENTLNEKREKESQLKNGDKIYLLTKNLQTKRLSQKFDHIKVGPFKIKKQVSKVNYTLELLISIKVYLIFYISLFKPADPETLL